MIGQEMATVGEVLAAARASLREDSEHPSRDAVLLLAHALDKPSSYPHLHPEDTVSPPAEALFMELIRRRKAGEPVAYLRGYQEFMGMRFRVDRRVLIPRPETEILVEAAMEEMRSVAQRTAGTCSANSCKNGNDVEPDGYTIADLCCGSGAIGLSLARMLPLCHVVLTDVSRDALDVAEVNAALLGVRERVEFMDGDLAAPLLAAGMTAKFDLVASNPPYIAREEMDALPRDVRCFEPHLALDGGPQGLTLVERLAAEVPEILKSGGLFLMEIGDGQGQVCQDIFAKDGRWRESQVMLDYAGRQRVFKVRKGS